MDDLNAMLAQLGGGAGAAVILTSVLKRAIDIPARFLPLLAVVSGFAISVVIAFGTGALGPSAFVAAFFAGLSAVGAYETATRSAGL